MSQGQQGSGPNGIPNRALKHLPQGAVSILVLVFNAIFLTHHFRTACKHTRVISILNPGNDPALPNPIGQLVFWTRLVNYLKKSYWIGPYKK